MHEEPKQIGAEEEVLRGLQYSIGPSKDYGQAFALFRKAADQGSANGEYSVAQSYETGHGVDKDVTQAVVWYRKAAEQGVTGARARLRTMFVQGQLIPIDDDQGGKWWRGLVQQADDESQSFSRTYAAAAQNNADAEVELGIDYLTGVGVSTDHRTRRRLFFSKPPDKARLKLSVSPARFPPLTKTGLSPAETKHAADLCLNAAKDGYADAQLILGTFYTMGRGVPRDATQAAFWHRKAAEQGRPDAEYMLPGYDYERGNGVPKDDAQSVIWLRKAADQGRSTAMFSLGIQASVANITGKEDPLHDRALAQKFIDLGAEYTSSDLERGLLRNMWATWCWQKATTTAKAVESSFGSGLKSNGSRRSMTSTGPRPTCRTISRVQHVPPEGLLWGNVNGSSGST